MTAERRANGKLEILIAEDSPTQAEQLRSLLEGRGYAVTAAGNGREALALLGRHKPALVISDIVMPELDGYGLCKAIKADKALKDIPVILVTTLSDPQDVIRGLECGADNFLRKPYDERHLLSRIDYLLMNIELRKNQKMQMGVEIQLGGRRHFINAERQQILDLLISTYEQAVEVNGELKQREQELMQSSAVLRALFRIAEGLNEAGSEREVVEAVLERALELPGVQAGWIFLREGASGFRLAGARNLPPALRAPGAMVHDCECRRQLVSGQLDSVTNILECERLASAPGDAGGLRFHASVPLWVGDRTLGVMNLVGPEEGLFEEHELDILYSVGNQVAVALERAHLNEHLERMVEERTAALKTEIARRERVEQEQARLVAIIEGTPDMVATGDPSGHVLYYNRTGLRMLGLEPDLDLSTVRFLDTHPAWAARLVAETGIPHAIEHGTWSGETALLGRDGREIPVSQVIIAHKSADGAVHYLSTIARDITQQKEHERYITRLSRVYAVLSGINTTIVRTRDRQELFDEACRIAVEEGQFRLAWVGLLDANGLDVTPVARAGVDEGYLDSIQLTARSNAPNRCELLAEALRDKAPVVCNDIDTDPRMARWRDEALRRGFQSVVVFPLEFDGKVVGVLLLYASEKSFFDTQEMRLLAELASDVSFALNYIEADNSRQVQSAALNAAADAIVVADCAGAIEWVNPAFTRLTGYTAEEALGRGLLDLVKSGKHPSAFYGEVWMNICSGRPWSGRMINRRKDGSLYTEDQTVTTILDVSGAPAHLVAIKKDVTDYLRLEAQLRQTQKMESVGRLASGIAHDFNNLLTVINGMADLVMGQVREDDPVHADVAEIHRAGEQAARLTRQLLAFSRQQILEPRVMNVNSVVTEMESLLRRLLGEDVDLVVALAPDLGSVKADTGQIEQALTNLAVNARDAMPQGGRLTIETRDITIDSDYVRQHGVDAPPGQYVMLSVSDSGIGMDEATRARIFDPFFTTKEPGKGTGLGLATVYGIVTQSQGFLWVESEVGQGASFQICLPRVTEAVAPERSEPAVGFGRGSETILIVEDNAELRRLARRFLDRGGYTVIEAATGDEALRLLEQHEEAVHLLVSDVVMPGMSGRQLAEEFARRRPGMRVLYMSGYTSDIILRHGVSEAKMYYLDKPFTESALLRKVRLVLDSTV